MQHDFHTLLVSDWHFGAIGRRPDIVRKVLDDFSYKKLILLGDIFSDPLTRFSNAEKEVLRRIAEHPDVVYIEGNHDHKHHKFIAEQLHASLALEYSWEVSGVKFLAWHGHFGDLIYRALPGLSKPISLVYQWLREIYFLTPLLKFIDRYHAILFFQDSKVRKASRAKALQQGADIVLAGHTHRPAVYDQEPPKYINTGCLTEKTKSEFTFAGVDHQGRAYLIEYFPDTNKYRVLAEVTKN